MTKTKRKTIEKCEVTPNKLATPLKDGSRFFDFPAGFPAAAGFVGGAVGGAAAGPAPSS